MDYNSHNNNVSRPRKGENDKQITFRVNRLYSIGDNWYFSTREGIDQGPFNNKKRAEYAVVNFINEKQS